MATQQPMCATTKGGLGGISGLRCSPQFGSARSLVFLWAGVWAYSFVWDFSLCQRNMGLERLIWVYRHWVFARHTNWSQTPFVIQDGPNLYANMHQHATSPSPSPQTMFPANSHLFSDYFSYDTRCAPQPVSACAPHVTFITSSFTEFGCDGLKSHYILSTTLQAQQKTIFYERGGRCRFIFKEEKHANLKPTRLNRLELVLLREQGRCLCFVFTVLIDWKAIFFFQTLTAPPPLLLKQLLLIRVQSWALKRMEGWQGLGVGGYRGISDTNSFPLSSPPPLSLSFPLT